MTWPTKIVAVVGVVTVPLLVFAMARWNPRIPREPWASIIAFAPLVAMCVAMIVAVVRA